MSGGPECLNLGCGSRLLAGWTNVDFVSRHPGVLACDLRCPLPFATGRFELVYHAHVLEHFDRATASRFLRECLRVLKPGGLLRVVVPDLEQMARRYLGALDAARAGGPNAAADHEWATIHLLDQLARHRAGGEMLEYVSRAELPNEAFVLATWGAEARTAIGQAAVAPATVPPGPLARVRRALVRILLGAPDYHALAVGRFRVSGEAHQWMYDRLSLASLLSACGFASIEARDASHSAFDGWAALGLDAEPDGVPVRPDSLYLEARKPGA